MNRNEIRSTSAKAAWHRLNVPCVSISMTVLKPFGERFSAAHRKLEDRSKDPTIDSPNKSAHFPAAPLIKQSNRPYFSTVDFTAR